VVTAVETPVGTAEIVTESPASAPIGLLALGHGAGGGIDAPDLVAVTALALQSGLMVARIRQPYRVAGRRAPAPAAQLDLAWTTVLAQLRAGAAERALPLIVGGRSSGARVACRTAVGAGAAGVLALAFPLHPPGHPEKSRASELGVGLPLLVVQGDRDAFGTASDFPVQVIVCEVAGADHRLAASALSAQLDRVRSWLLATIEGASGGATTGGGIGP
jgi:predicted alpha/beta-hydrolase family hydrolase